MIQRQAKVTKQNKVCVHGVRNCNPLFFLKDSELRKKKSFNDVDKSLEKKEIYVCMIVLKQIEINFQNDTKNVQLNPS